MTIQEAIDRVDSLKPNKFTADQKIAWLSELDGMIHQELVMTHEMGGGAVFFGYEPCTPTDTQLLVPFPYTDIYQHYLAMQMDLSNAELQKYQNDKTLFNAAYITYSDFYTRTFRPIQKVREFRL